MVITIIECGFLWFVDNLICGSRVCVGGGGGEFLMKISFSLMRYILQSYFEAKKLIKCHVNKRSPEYNILSHSSNFFSIVAITKMCAKQGDRYKYNNYCTIIVFNKFAFLVNTSFLVHLSILHLHYYVLKNRKYFPFQLGCRV